MFTILIRQVHISILRHLLVPPGKDMQPGSQRHVTPVNHLPWFRRTPNDEHPHVASMNLFQLHPTGVPRLWPTAPTRRVHRRVITHPHLHQIRYEEVNAFPATSMLSRCAIAMAQGDSQRMQRSYWPFRCTTSSLCASLVSCSKRLALRSALFVNCQILKARSTVPEIAVVWTSAKSSGQRTVLT